MRKWEYKMIAFQLHRKKGKKVQHLNFSGWCTVPSDMWNWKPTE